jgi:putative acetyltransferase
VDIQLRKALLADLEVMHRVRRDAILGDHRGLEPDARQAWADRRSADFYTERVAAGDVVIASRAGVDVGWGSGTGDQVTALYVRFSCSRLGVGRALMSELEAAIVARGCAWASLDSSPNAVGFYAKLGYVRVGLPKDDGALPMSKHVGARHSPRSGVR